jgi:hypothetical protein
MQQQDPISDSIQHERDAISKENLLDQLRLDFTRAAMEVKLYSSQPSIQQSVPPPDNFQIQYRELPYFTWFVKEGPTLFGLQHLFPTSMGMLYALSVNHPVLYHAILAVSTHFVDTGMRREIGLDDHLGGILQQIQDAIANEQFDDGHIYALFLLGAMYIFRSKLDLGAKYLYGMSLMIKRAESKRRRRGDDTGKSPLIGFVLRVAISLLNRVPVEQQWVLEVDFNLLKAEMEDTWVDDLTEGGYQAGLARATYILNQCMFSILRLTHFVTGVRASQQYNPHIHEPQINFEVGKIATILRQLQDRFATQARGPTIGETTQPPQEVFEPVPGITDISFGYRLMASYMLTIALTFVQNSRIGLISQQRYDAALDLCRTYAAVQGTRSTCPNLPVLTALWFAGLTFGPRTHFAGYSPRSYRSDCVRVSMDQRTLRKIRRTLLSECTKYGGKIRSDVESGRYKLV